MTQLLGAVGPEVLGHSDRVVAAQMLRNKAPMAEAIVVGGVHENTASAGPLTDAAVLGAHVPGELLHELAVREEGALKAVRLVHVVPGLMVQLAGCEGRVAAIAQPVNPVGLQ